MASGLPYRISSHSFKAPSIFAEPYPKFCMSSPFSASETVAAAPSPEICLNRKSVSSPASATVSVPPPRSTCFACSSACVTARSKRVVSVSALSVRMLAEVSIIRIASVISEGVLSTIAGFISTIARHVSASIWHRNSNRLRILLTGTFFFFFFRLSFHTYVLETVFC